MQTTVATVAILLVCLPINYSNALYVPEYETPLENWSCKEVQFWFVSIGMPHLVGIAARQQIDGRTLMHLSESQLLVREFQLDGEDKRRLIQEYADLVFRIASRTPTDNDGILTPKPYLHFCQYDDFHGCHPSLNLALLLFPRLNVLFGDVDGVPLSSLPWKYKLMWWIAPHSAYLHYGLEAFGLGLSVLILQALRMLAAIFGPIVDAALVQIICGVFSLALSKEAFDKTRTILPMIGNTISALTLVVDYFCGWYIGPIRLLLFMRDVVIAAQLFGKCAATLRALNQFNDAS